MGTADGLITAMRQLIGTGENPPGSNRNALTNWYADRHGEQYRATPWCNIAVSYAAAQSDNTTAVLGDHAWTVEHANAFHTAGRWHTGTAGIQPGDVVFYDWDGTRTIAKIDHVGVVETVHGDGTVTAIEGNTSDVCARRHRGGSVIAGYGRPAYDGSPTPTQQPDRLAEDGQLGPLTIRRWQQIMGTPVDGVISPVSDLVKAVQRHLNSRIGAGLVVDGIGIRQDGRRYQTVRALQRYLGTPVDGVLTPGRSVAVVALQQRLNNGSF